MYDSQHCWYKVSEEEIQEAISLCGFFKYKVSSKIFKNYHINTYLQDEILFNELKNIHFSKKHNTSSKKQFIASIYIGSSMNMHFFEEKGLDYLSIDNKFVCLYSSENSIALVMIASHGYGIVKSCIFGVGTYNLLKYKYFPVHGLVLQINNKGILFIGGNKSGKSTLLFSLLKKYDKIKILTDDWSIIRLEENYTRCYGIDNFISIKDDEIKDFNFNYIQKVNTSSKVYIPLKKEKKNKLNIDKIYFLDINSKKLLIKEIDATLATTFLIKASYHSPWGSNEILEDERNKLKDVLSSIENKIFYSFSKDLSNLDDVIEVLINDICELK